MCIATFICKMGGKVPFLSLSLSFEINRYNIINLQISKICISRQAEQEPQSLHSHTVTLGHFVVLLITVIGLATFDA
jgi:hypothetical protein